MDYWNEIRSALAALLGQPVVVAGLVLLAGLHAAIWLLVLERAGLPSGLAVLLLLPPLTLAVPLYVALVRWPSEARPRFPRRRAVVRAPSTQRRRLPAQPTNPAPSFHPHGPLRLAADGFPVVRIPLVPTALPASWPSAATRRAGDLYGTLAGHAGP